MNLVENRTLPSQLRDEEAVVVENAVRLAIDSVLNVLYGLNGARTREYQRMLADRDKEIQRLEGRLAELERELQVMRRYGCTCGLFEAGTRISGPGQAGEEIRTEAGGLDPEGTAEPQQCDNMSLSLGIYARPSSHYPSQYHESILTSSPSCLGINSTCTSRSSEASGVADAAKNPPTSPSSLAVKEEPCDVDAVLIEWELSEEKAAEAGGGAGDLCLNRQSPGGKHTLPEHQENNESRILNEKTPGRPPGFRISAGDQLKNRKKNVPMSQLTEEAQRLKRAAWRAASKRYYARKIARQQATLQHVSHAVNSPHSFSVDERRKRLISDLPVESQMLRREVWRAASRRYYGRKAARQTQSLQYGHLMENLNPGGAMQAPNGDVTNGGIKCS